MFPIISINYKDWKGAWAGGLGNMAESGHGPGLSKVCSWLSKHESGEGIQVAKTMAQGLQSRMYINFTDC